MRSYLRILFITLFVAAVAMAGSAAELMGRVEAVYHEGVMSFNVEHVDAVSASVRVYDLETDAMVFDSGAQARTTVTWPAGHDLKGAYRYVVTAWDTEGQVVVSQAASTKSFTPIADIDFDTIKGNTTLLGPNEVIIDSNLQVGTPTQAFRVDDDFVGKGGAWYLYEEDGSIGSKLEAESSGEGGYFRLFGPGSSYVLLQSMGAGSQPEMILDGTTSDFSVHTGNSGNGSVVMPVSAVYDAEILDEPGVVEEAWGSSWTVPTTPTNAIIRTITAPTAGYVFATAVIDIAFSHTSGTTSWVTCSISDTSNTLYLDGDHNFQISTNAPTGAYSVPIAMTRIFAIPAGANQLYVVCDTSSGVTATAWDRHFDILFVPTAYGTVGPPKRGGGDGHMEGVEGYVSPNTYMSEAETQAERMEAIQNNLDRIQAELAEVRAQSEAVQANSENN